MALKYYDDAIVAKLKKWIPSASKLKVLKPDETKRLFELTADETNDKPIKLPLVAVSKDLDIELLSTSKSVKSFDGLRLYPEGITPNSNGYKGQAYIDYVNTTPAKLALFNVLPIKLSYQLDIYTKKAEDGEEYMRAFLFKLINNPTIKIEIPYNGLNIEHIANIRVRETVSDTSAISERIFSGQFTRWTIQFDIQDAFLFSIPYKDTWKIIVEDDAIEFDSVLELSESINEQGDEEQLGFKFVK